MLYHIYQTKATENGFSLNLVGYTHTERGKRTWTGPTPTTWTEAERTEAHSFINFLMQRATASFMRAGEVLIHANGQWAVKRAE